MYSYGYGAGTPGYYAPCPPVGYGYPATYGGNWAAIVLVLFILLVIILGSRFVI
jgi:uncharacterized protein (TIGR01732 family)